MKNISLYKVVSKTCVSGTEDNGMDGFLIWPSTFYE